MTTRVILSAADLVMWADAASGPDANAALAELARRAYTDRWPNSKLLTFQFSGADFWFDTFDDPHGRESRTVAGWTRIPVSVGPRDAVRQRGYPIAAELAERGFERGHLIARASGGGLDVNLFPQAWQVNRGVGDEGKRFRALERLAAAHAGALHMTRLIWTDESNVPTYVHMIVAPPDHDVVQHVFGNEPILRRRSR